MIKPVSLVIKNQSKRFVFILARNEIFLQCHTFKLPKVSFTLVSQTVIKSAQLIISLPFRRRGRRGRRQTFDFTINKLLSL